MSVGEWLENFTIARADNALKDLASLIPSTITVRRDGKEIVIPIEQLKLDEAVLVHAGERFGVDGSVSRGTMVASTNLRLPANQFLWIRIPAMKFSREP